MPQGKTNQAAGVGSYFGDGYFHLYRNYLLREDQTRAEVDYLLRWLRPRAGQRWLDMPCGYGRHLRELRRRRPGLRLAGGDLNFNYLRAYQNDLCGAAVPGGGATGVTLCDMRRLPFAAGAFHAVINMLNSFGYYPTGRVRRGSDPGDIAILAEWARVLRTGGSLVMDLANRRALVELVGRQSAIHYGGGGYDVVEEFAWSPKAQILSNETVWRWTGGTERAGYRLRLYTPAQIGRLLAGAGFELLEIAGDFTGEAFDPLRSDRMLVLARKR